MEGEAMSDKILLRTNAITKDFGPTKALKGVSVEVRRGEVHGLIGENGSGKSTLSSIVAGAQRASGGEMFFADKPYRPFSMLEANSSGVGMIVQEMGTIPGITVAANIFLGKERRFAKAGLLDVGAMLAEARMALEAIGAGHISSADRIDLLSFEDKKLVEIARALHANPSLLIVDETTTALTQKGRDILYTIMDRLRGSGGSVLFISHDIDEIMTRCDRLTILRDGTLTGTLDKPQFEPSEIRRRMIGREIKGAFYRDDYGKSTQGEVALRVEGLSVGAIRDVNLELHRGEILGIGGLTESGMHELGRAMYGLVAPERGSVKTAGGARIDSPRAAIAAGIGYVSKDRDKEALMVAASVRDNLCLPSLGQIGRGGFITPKAERSFTNEWVGKLDIKLGSLNQFCMHLSGGNKQKVSLGKWLGKGSDILLLDCPTRGIDVGVKAAIYKLLTELRLQDKSIMMISEELPELIGMSDRIIVFKDGAISKEFERSESLSEAVVIEYMI
jgi:ribose transport system ATP-binding protein